MKILLEEKEWVSHTKRNSKYFWILESITGKVETPEEPSEYLPSSSETGYLQNVKEEILEKINAENIFSFPYDPSEGDYLSIKNNLRKNEYLNLIFLNNSWVEEVYTCTLRDCEEDIYTTIKTGVAFLSENTIAF